MAVILKVDRSKAERDLIAGTISDLRDSIEEMESRIQYMNEELEAKKKRLETWHRRLSELKAQSGDLSERRRRPKGENLRAVIAALQGAVVSGLAASEIQRKTGLPWSSIQATLKRNPQLFAEGNGLWRLRPTGMASALNAMNGDRQRDRDEEELIDPDEGLEDPSSGDDGGGADD